MPVGLQVDTNCVFAIGNKIIRNVSSKGTRAGDRFALHAFIDQLPRRLELQPPLRCLDFRCWHKCEVPTGSRDVRV
jgi:hypothetical protein